MVDKIKILYIEDDSIDQMVFQRFVKEKRLPYECSLVSKIIDAKKLLIKEDFDLILADYMLPDGNLLEILPTIKHCPIIAITGRGSEAIAAQAIKEGAFDYLIKDPDRNYLEILPTTIDVAIKQFAANKELKLLRIALENSLEGIAKLNEEGIYISVNNAYAKSLGYKPEELIEKNWEITIQKEDIGKVKAAYENMLNQGKGETEARGLKKDGSVFYKEIVMIKPKEEDFNFYFLFIKDITERKKSYERKIAQEREESLLQKTQELERSNKELEQFAYIASHDLQEPLRTVATYTKLLEERYKDKIDEKANKYIDFAVNGAKTMQELISALLDYSRIQRLPKDIENVDCNELLSELVSKVVQPQEAEVKINYSNLPTVNANKIQLKQVFHNLIGNALKYKSTEPLTINISANKKDNKNWLFTVEDNGIGFEMEYAQRIFMLFERLHSKRQYEGTGMGLAICKKIIENHGGEIWAKATPGKGSIFYFTLPV